MESEPVTGTIPTETEDGGQIVHCDVYDPANKGFCKKLKASCARHSGLSSYRQRRGNEVEVG